MKHERRRRPRGQVGGDDLEAFLHLLAGADEVGPGLEDQDDRESCGTDFERITSSPSIRLQRLLQRDRDELLHLLGGEAKARTSGSRRVVARTPGRRPPACPALGHAVEHQAPRQCSTTMKRNFRLVPTIQRIMAVRPTRYLSTPNSAPYNSADPTVTTNVPSAGPFNSAAVSPSMKSTVIAARSNTKGSGLVYTQVPPSGSYMTAE